jgi:hypothetical protein
MKNIKKIKRHLDCDFLLKESKDTYCCCDSRSPWFGKELNQQIVMQEACQFFHLNKEKYNNESEMIKTTQTNIQC